MQISNRLIGIFKISDLLKILGFNKKTSRETREKKNFLPFPQCIIVDNKKLNHSVSF